MLRVNEDKLLNRIAELTEEQDSAKIKSKAEAQSIAVSRGYSDDLEQKIEQLLYENRYRDRNVEDERIYLLKFIEDEPEYFVEKTDVITAEV